MTRGRAGTFRKSRDWDGLGCGYSAATADPFASVGMTRGERVLFGRVATGMDGIQCGYSAATADPFASVRDDKGESGYFSEESRLGWTRVRLLRSDCRSLRFGRDDKGRAGTFRKSRDWDGRNSVRLLRGDCRSLRFGSG